MALTISKHVLAFCYVLVTLKYKPVHPETSSNRTCTGIAQGIFCRKESAQQAHQC